MVTDLFGQEHEEPGDEDAAAVNLVNRGFHPASGETLVPLHRLAVEQVHPDRGVTCGSCEFFRPRQKKCWHAKMQPPGPVDARWPGCEHWRLAPHLSG